MMPRKIVIGDIHGALKALEQLLVKFEIKPDDHLIFLGDYVDGWLQSADLIEYLIDLEKIYQCIFLKGNHDAWCLSWLNGNHADSDWLLHGGQSTVKSYNSYSAVHKAKHVLFFESLRNYYEDGSGNLYIHAGFTSTHGPSQEHDESNCYWDRTLWEMALTIERQVNKVSNIYPKQLLLYDEIYIGHTPTINYNSFVPMHACNVWNIDTGAAFYGKLSAMDVTTKEYWQSDTVQLLYPGEKGRNRQ